MSPHLLRGFLHYTSKVYGFREIVAGYTDYRHHPQIAPGAGFPRGVLAVGLSVAQSAAAGALTGKHSFVYHSYKWLSRQRSCSRVLDRETCDIL